MGGVSVLVFYTSSDDGLYSYQVSRKYLGRYQRYGADTKSYRTDGGHDIIRHVFDGRIKIQRTREKPRSMPHSCLYFINRKPEKEKNIL